MNGQHDPQCATLAQKNPSAAQPAEGNDSNVGGQSTPKALGKQEGGSHYLGFKIQPIEYIHANGIGFSEGNVIKLVSRWRGKNGIEDLRKAIHHIELLIELEAKTNGQ